MAHDVPSGPAPIHNPHRPHGEDSSSTEVKRTVPTGPFPIYNPPRPLLNRRS